MEQTKLIFQAKHLVNDAEDHNALGHQDAADTCLAELIELLTAELTGGQPDGLDKPEESPNP